MNQTSFISKGVTFLHRQDRDWKVTVVRTSLHKLVYQMVFPYLSLYIIALGASATQLGFVNSLGMIGAGIISPLTGWFLDRSGPKKIYLFGISLLAVSYFTYGIAHSWTTTVFAMAAYWLGLTISMHSCSLVCGNCLTNEDRATGMNICETVTAGVLGMIGPMIGASLVSLFGGVNVSSIRPLFFVSLMITILSFVFVWAQLSDRKWGLRVGKPNLLKDLHQVLKEGRNVKRWLIISSINGLPVAMVFPFSQVYAYEMKGASPFVLGAMVTGSAMASIVSAIPLGRLADKIGRKKVLYITIPLFWLSNLMLVWAPNSAFLVAAGILQGFFYIGGPISGAMERELVAPEYMGRWLGITRFFRMLLSAFMVLVAGVIWDKAGPQYVFLAFVGIEVALRMPLLIGMPETLNLDASKPMAVGTR